MPLTILLAGKLKRWFVDMFWMNWKWDKTAEVEESGRIRQSVVFRSHVEVNLVPIFSSSKIWKESRYQVVIESRRIWFNHFYWFKEMLLMQIIESVLIGSIHSCFDYWLITAVLVIQSWNITQCGSVTFVKSLIHFRVTEKKECWKCGWFHFREVSCSNRFFIVC